MNIIQMPRGTGKTTNAIRYVLRRRAEGKRAYLVVDTGAMADILSYDHKEAANYILPVHKVQREVQGRGRNVELVVDELDAILYALLGAPVKLATLTVGGNE